MKKMPFEMLLKNGEGFLLQQYSGTKEHAERERGMQKRPGQNLMEHQHGRDRREGRSRKGRQGIWTASRGRAAVGWF